MWSLSGFFPPFLLFLNVKVSGIYYDNEVSLTSSHWNQGAFLNMLSLFKIHTQQTCAMLCLEFFCCFQFFKFNVMRCECFLESMYHSNDIKAVRPDDGGLSLVDARLPGRLLPVGSFRSLLGASACSAVHCFSYIYSFFSLALLERSGR